MSDEKQSKWQRWVAIFLITTAVPSYATYWWINEPRPVPQFNQEQLQRELEQFTESYRKYIETFKSQNENEEQDKPVEEAENESVSSLPTNN